MRHMLVLALLCLIGIPGLAQSNSTRDSAKASSPDENIIKQIEDDLLNAERTSNPSAIEKVLADDYVNLLPRGLGSGKAEILSGIRPHAGQTPPYTTESENMHIFIFGDTAVAAYTKIYTAKENGNVAREDTTHIFQKDHGDWKLKLCRATLHGSDLE